VQEEGDQEKWSVTVSVFLFYLDAMDRDNSTVSFYLTKKLNIYIK
jgi:hypothetical protein